MDIEKAFDFVDHSILFRDVKKWIWAGSSIRNIGWKHF